MRRKGSKLSRARLLPRTDVLQERKSVHLKLDKGVHAALRARLFAYNVSIQEVFEEFSRLLVTDAASGGSNKATSIVESFVNKKIKIELEKVRSGPLPRRKNNELSELDAETLYNLINEADKEDGPKSGDKNEAA